ncbi:unnamed protein product, partial [Tetraodon nigroviridis]
SPAMYQVQMPHMTVSQSKPYRPGKVPNLPQQRSDQHHLAGTPTMMHPATAAGAPIVAPSPAYPAQYFTCSPQQFASQPLVQQMTHYQSQVGLLRVWTRSICSRCGSHRLPRQTGLERCVCVLSVVARGSMCSVPSCRAAAG